MSTMKRVVGFFDHLEDHVRMWLSRYPILYAFIGGTGIVLFWKGVWETAEKYDILFGPVSIALSVLILLLSGLFVSYFIGDSIIITGLKREKKLVEKTEEEVREEAREEVVTMEHIQQHLNRIEALLKEKK